MIQKFKTPKNESGFDQIWSDGKMIIIGGSDIKNIQIYITKERITVYDQNSNEKQHISFEDWSPPYVNPKNPPAGPTGSINSMIPDLTGGIAYTSLGMEDLLKTLKDRGII